MSMLNKPLNRRLVQNISKTSRGRYRCRIMRQGKLYETYTPNLALAKTWINKIKAKHTS